MPLYFILVVVCSICEESRSLWQGDRVTKKDAEGWARSAGWKKVSGNWVCPDCIADHRVKGLHS